MFGQVAAEILVPKLKAMVADDDRFDGLYLNVAQTTQGIEPLLDSVFSFLRRKTDFFAGPPGSGEKGVDAAIQKVQDVVSKHADIYKADKAKKTGSTAKKKSSPPKQAKKKVEELEPEVLEASADGGFDISPSKPPAKEAPKATKEATQEDSVKKEVNSESTEDASQEAENEAPPPLGNGGTVEGKYVWTQTLGEVNVTLPLPDGTRGRDMNVSIAKKHLKVGLKKDKRTWIIDDPLVKTIICDDSFWTIEDGNRLVVNLQKLNQMEWWEGVCVGHPTIDVKKIQPENSNLGDLDGETRQTVEKMMFDQKQKALGLPTSDEQKKFEMLEKFKKAHPEMDFSNAKLS